MIILASLLCAAAIPQTVGGGADQMYQWNGVDFRDYFGNAIANAGDVNNDGYDDVVIGAPGRSTGAFSDNGTAFVYSGLDGTVLYSLEGNQSGDDFGEAVSGAGDVNSDGFDDFLIGAPDAVSRKGEAYCFSGATGTVIYTWTGTASNGDFGGSVAGGSDLNGDGVPDIVIAAREANLGGLSDQGAVYFYSGNGGGLIRTLNGYASNDFFGSDAAMAGDLDGDGTDEVLVAAFGADPGGNSSAGSVYAFSGATGTLVQQWDGASAYIFFGRSIDNAGDVDGDGVEDVIIGADAASPNAVPSAGSAYIYSGATAALLFQIDGDGPYYYLGYAVSGAGDFNNDGYADVMAGAYQAYVTGLGDAGRVFLHSGFDGSLIQAWDGHADGDFFGISLAAGGDLDQDGNQELLIGADRADPNYAGAVYAYTYSPYMSTNVATVSASAGGVIDFSLDFPAANGGMDYKVLISQTGTGPTTYGVDIPLTQDSLVIDTFFGNYPLPGHSGMHGTLDAFGDATASMPVPAGIPSGLVGAVFYTAAIAFPSGQLPEASSVAVDITVVP